MIRTLGLTLIAAFVIAPLPAHDCCGHTGYHHGGWDCGPQSQHCCWQWTDALNVETLQGTVAEINALTGSPIVEIWLKSAKDTTLVRLAPEPYLRQSGFNLKPGDALSVSGYWANSAHELFVASELELAGKKLVMRGSHGRPAW